MKEKTEKMDVYLEYQKAEEIEQDLIRSMRESLEYGEWRYQQKEDNHSKMYIKEISLVGGDYPYAYGETYPYEINLKINSRKNPTKVLRRILHHSNLIGEEMEEASNGQINFIIWD